MSKRSNRTAVLAVAVGMAVTFATPAHAAPSTNTDPVYACWGSLDTGDSLCALDEATLKTQVREQYGVLLAKDSNEAAKLRDSLALSTQNRSSGPTPLAVGDPAVGLYDGASYGGTYIILTTTNSGCGVNGAVLGNFTRGSWPLTWDNAVSSYQSKRSGCSYTIRDGNYYTGDSYGPAFNAPGVGAMNNRASSISS